MRTAYSPYDMCNEALRLIKECSDNVLTKDIERQILYLLNKAEEYSNMSLYQLALAHKELADMYYKFEYTGSALKHYNIGLKMYEKLPVKRKISQLNKMPAETLSYSLDANIVGEPDYSNIPNRSSDITYISSSEDILRNKMIDDARAYLTEQAKEESNIYDAEFEQMIEERLSKLDDLSRAEFYRLRHNKNDGVLSSQKLDLLTLEAMEKSYNYKKDK